MQTLLLEITTTEKIAGKVFSFTASGATILVVIIVVSMVLSILLHFSLLNLYRIAAEMKKIRMLFEDITDDGDIKLNSTNQSSNDSGFSIEDDLYEMIREYKKKLKTADNDQVKAEIAETIESLRKIVGKRGEN
ncbi:MAG: hypothetical protein J6Y20_03140 [Lachnospiraceae bacterium]|nr:hypothetical protein [Lachnospiraceae bacterium]